MIYHGRLRYWTTFIYGVYYHGRFRYLSSLLSVVSAHFLMEQAYIRWLQIQSGWNFRKKNVHGWKVEPPLNLCLMISPPRISKINKWSLRSDKMTILAKVITLLSKQSWLVEINYVSFVNDVHLWHPAQGTSNIKCGDMNMYMIKLAIHDYWTHMYVLRLKLMPKK